MNIILQEFHHLYIIEFEAHFPFFHLALSVSFLSLISEMTALYYDFSFFIIENIRILLIDRIPPMQLLVAMEKTVRH